MSGPSAVSKAFSPLDVSDSFKAHYARSRDVSVPPATTPLHIAALNGDERRVLVLLTRQGVDPSARDRNGYTPLHLACLLGRTSIVATLLERGASANAIALDGNTPLHKAAQGGHAAIAKQLIEAGADVLVANVNGELAVDMCAQRKHTEVTSFLRRAMSTTSS